MVCRTKRPKDELRRIARTPTGAIIIDRSGSAPGRGAYLCVEGTCRATAAADRSALARSLRASIPADLLGQHSTETHDRTKMIPGGSHGT